MSHIFLSYSRDDARFMGKLANDLRGAGFGVWIDETGLPPGTPQWTAAIQDAIEESFCLVVILSPDAKESQWVTREIRYADEQGRAVVPVLASGSSRSAIPIELIATQYIDARREYQSALGLLLTRLHQLAGTPPGDVPRPRRRLRVWPLLLGLLAVVLVGGVVLAVLSGIPQDLLAQVAGPSAMPDPTNPPAVTPAPPASTTEPPPPAPTLTPTPPHAPPIVNDSGVPLFEEHQMVVSVSRGTEVTLAGFDLWSAPLGAEPSCASGVIKLTWIVREPYPIAEDDFEIHQPVPRGGGITEFVVGGLSGELTFGYCGELIFTNLGLEDYLIEIRYASALFE